MCPCPSDLKVQLRLSALTLAFVPVFLAEGRQSGSIVPAGGVVGTEAELLHRKTSSCCCFVKNNEVVYLSPAPVSMLDAA